MSKYSEAAIKKVFGEGVHPDFIKEIQNGTATIPASRQKELDKVAGIKKEEKPLHSMINKRADGSFGVKIPFDMKDAFKKQFSSAKWDGATKEWTVGKLSGQKLNDWLQDKIPHIEKSQAKKAEFEKKVAEMHQLKGNTFDIKDDIKNKFGGVFKDGHWHVTDEHKEAAQAFVNEYNAKQKEQKTKSNKASSKDINAFYQHGKPTEEEQARLDKWMRENPADEEDLRFPAFYYAVAKDLNMDRRGNVYVE